MVKFTATTRDVRKLIGFGLSRANIEKLMAGRPILIVGEVIGEAHREFLIFFGETEAAMRDMMADCITPETITHGDPDA
jgi:hypothetical protein